ncbi:hypothetical protein ACRAWF_46180 [Streptomyces sp. L7]
MAASASLPLPARSKRVAEPSANLEPELLPRRLRGRLGRDPAHQRTPADRRRTLTSEPPLADTAPLTSESAVFADPDSTRP